MPKEGREEVREGWQCSRRLERGQGGLAKGLLRFEFFLKRGRSGKVGVGVLDF